MATKEDILDAIAEMSVLELSELLKEFEERFDVTAAAPVAAVAAAPAGAGETGSTEEENDAFDVVLAGAGDKKIQVIKEVRALTNLGLKDAKELVDGAPNVVLEGAAKDDAEKAKESLEAAGATVELKQFLGQEALVLEKILTFRSVFLNKVNFLDRSGCNSSSGSDNIRHAVDVVAGYSVFRETGYAPQVFPPH